MIIYIDMVFAVNFIMDLTILWSVGLILRELIKPFRLILGALTGSLIYIVTLYMPYINILVQIIVILLSLTISVTIAYKPVGIINLFKQIIMAFILSFLLAGIMFAVINLKYITNGFNTDAITENFSYKLLFTVTGLVYSGLKIGIKKLRQNNFDKRKFYNIEIVIGGKSIFVKALADSGNSLRDNLFDNEIIIVEKGMLKNITDLNGGIRFIPFKSLGNKNGIIPAIKADLIICEKVRKTNILIAVYNGKLGSDFNALVKYNFLK